MWADFFYEYNLPQIPQIDLQLFTSELQMMKQQRLVHLTIY